MRVWAVFKKSLVEQFRDYKAVLLTILSPIVFIVIFGLAFGQGFYTYSLAISDEDQGARRQPGAANRKQRVSERKYDV